MSNIRNLNIWKSEEKAGTDRDRPEGRDISELNLSARSYNSLKRADCTSVGDVIRIMEEDGPGLRGIRNLGSRSEREIREAVAEFRASYGSGLACGGGGEEEKPIRKVIRPAKRFWEKEISEFHLSAAAEGRLRSCGICRIADLYDRDKDEDREDPGWYAVRELFGRIAAMS